MKTKSYLDILKLRKYLQSLSQISFSYSQINKTYSPLERQTDNDLIQVKEFYMGLIKEAKEIINKYENEYEQSRLD